MFTTLKQVLIVILKKITVPQTTLLKQQSYGHQKTTPDFLMVVNLTHEWLNSKNAILSKHSQITKLILDTNTIHTCTIVVFKTTFAIIENFFFSKYSLNLFIIVMRTALITIHNMKMFLKHIMKVLILSEAKHRNNLRMCTQPSQINTFLHSLH